MARYSQQLLQLFDLPSGLVVDDNGRTAADRFVKLHDRAFSFDIAVDSNLVNDCPRAGSAIAVCHGSGEREPPHAEPMAEITAGVRLEVPADWSTAD